MGQTLLEQLDPSVRRAILGQVPEAIDVSKEPVQYWARHTDIDEKSFDDIVDIAAIVLGTTIADDKRPRFAAFTQMGTPDLGYKEWRFNKYILEARRRIGAQGLYWVRFSLIPSNYNPDQVRETFEQKDFRENLQNEFPEL